MAKKQSASPEEEQGKSASDAAPPDAAAEGKKPKEAKPKDAKPKDAGPKEAGKEAKPKEGKPKEAKPKEAKAKPDKAHAAPARAAAPAAVPAPAGDGMVKKKGRQPGNPPHRGKKLRELLKRQHEKIAKEGIVPLKKAIGLLKSVKRAKFDETVEVHMALGIDSTQSDQMIRGSVALPHGVGKTVRVLVFCQGDNVAKAKEAGADFAGSDELIKKIQGEGWLEFDVALATQDMMGQVSRLGKVLGPRGLMPTPKAGTVITMGQDVSAAVREFKAGKVEYRSDKGGNVHAGVGKMSFEDDKLAANVTTFVDQIRAVKPAGVKGNYVKSITLTGTMTPGIPVTI
jgi:large subunit ribosomal protein L1